MKSKKLISLLCAAAVSATALTGIMINASAAQTEIWSNNFNATASGLIIDGVTTNAATDEGVIPSLRLVTTNRGDGDAGTYTDTNGDEHLCGSYYSIVDGKDGKGFLMSLPCFGDYAANGRWAHVDFIGDMEGKLVADAADDVILDFDVKMVDGSNKGEYDENYCNPILRFGSFDPSSKAATAIELSKKDANIGDDWAHVRIVVSNANGAKLYVNQQEVTAAAVANVKKIDSIGLYSYLDTANFPAVKDQIEKAGNQDYANPETPSNSPYAIVDNFVVYKETAGTANGTTTAPGAKEEGGATAPPSLSRPEPEKVAGMAPNVVAPDRVEDALSVNFNDEQTGMLVNIRNSNAADYDPEVPNEKQIAKGAMYVSAGDRADGGDATASIVKVDNGTQALKLTGGRFSTGGRSPMLHLTDNLEISSNTGSAVMAFAVYLSKADGDDNKSRIWLLDTDSEGGSEGANVNNSSSAEAYYKNVFAMITAEDEETDPDSAFGGDVTKNNKVLRVDPDMWHVITISVSEDKYRLFVDGNYAGADGRLAADLEGTNVNYGEGAAYMPINLPVIAIDNAGTDSPVKSKALVDNIVAYYADEMEKEWLPIVEEGEAPEGTPAPEDTPAPEATPTPAPTLAPAVSVKIDPVAVGATTVKINDLGDQTAQLIHASYDAEGRLTSVELVEAKPETTITAAAAGDKIAVWNVVSGVGMQPADAVVTVE